MEELNLREIEVIELEWNNRPNNSFDRFEGYFHKWCDIVSEDNKSIMVNALIEKEDGSIILIPLDRYKVKFIDKIVSYRAYKKKVFEKMSKYD